jgi:hypothetical protein
VTDDALCGGSSYADTVDVQVVNPGNGDFFQRTIQADNQYVAVYAANSVCELWGCPFNVDMWCENATGPKLLAQGDGVKYRYQLTLFQSLNWMFEGMITDWVNGGTLHYLEKQNAVMKKDGTVVWNVENIKLKSVPGK